jgi:hypothetical protein
VVGVSEATAGADGAPEGGDTDADPEPGGSGARARAGPAGDGAEAVSEGGKAITRRPTAVSGTLAVVAATAVVLVGALVSVPAVAAGSLGLVATGVAVTYGGRWLADLGGAALVLATVVAGLSGSEPATLACAVGTVLAWDLANNAIGMGQQLGREADTARAELVHAGASLGVGALTAGTSFVVYRAASGGQPVTAVFFLTLAALVLISSLRL